MKSKREMWKQFEKCWFAFSLSAMPRPFHLPGGGGVVLDFLPLLLARFIRLHPIGVLLLVCLPRPSHHILAAWLAHLLPPPPPHIPSQHFCLDNPHWSAALLRPSLLFQHLALVHLWVRVRLDRTILLQPLCQHFPLRRCGSRLRIGVLTITCQSIFFII